jgi:DNA polymerase II small subunit/DNA polymerase delta subunit B
LWAIYNDGKLFKNFEDLEMSDETKEDFRNAIQEFQSAIQDINFWKNFFKNIDHFAGWIGSKLNFSKDDFTNILKFIPQQFLEDTEIKEFLKRKMNNITAKNFIKNKDIEKTPWLFEDYINQFIEGSNNIYSEYRTICSYIKREIRNDQISGGMVGQFNPSITQRLNNLTEKSDITTNGKDISEIKVNIITSAKD